MSARLSWMARVEAYLAYRRCHGFELTIDATQLQSFARFADGIATDGHLTVPLAVAWAQTSQRKTSFTWARRIEILRGFACFCQREDPATEVPPRSLFGSSHRRLVPHIYTEAELCTLLDATRGLAPTEGLRPATCRCVFGLLAATGLRIGEALCLTAPDVDLERGVLHVREAKFHQQRLVPLHPSVTGSLRVYC